ncbi:MAG: 3D domain-containing protein [Bacillota bacterium]
MRLITLLLAAALTAGTPGVARASEAVLPAFQGRPDQKVTATAYTSGPESTGKRPGHPQYGITFTGTAARQGRTIAVDPELIPLGSRVYIHELREFRYAEDTGGAIRGSRIDLYMDEVSDALQWGMQEVHITVDPKI